MLRQRRLREAIEQRTTISVTSNDDKRGVDDQSKMMTANESTQLCLCALAATAVSSSHRREDAVNSLSLVDYVFVQW